MQFVQFVHQLVYHPKRWHLALAPSWIQSEFKSESSILLSRRTGMKRVPSEDAWRADIRQEFVRLPRAFCIFSGCRLRNHLIFVTAWRSKDHQREFRQECGLSNDIYSCEKSTQMIFNHIQWISSGAIKSIGSQWSSCVRPVEFRSDLSNSVQANLPPKPTPLAPERALSVLSHP